MQEFSAGLFRAMGQPELMEDPRFATRDARVRNSVILDELIQGWTGALTSRQVLDALSANGTPAAEIRSPSAALLDPVLHARGEVVQTSHPKYAGAELPAPGIPIVFSDATAEFDRGAPSLGEDTTRVLRELLGYSESQVEDLQSRAII